MIYMKKLVRGEFSADSFLKNHCEKTDFKNFKVFSKYDFMFQAHRKTKMLKLYRGYSFPDLLSVFVCFTIDHSRNNLVIIKGRPTLFSLVWFLVLSFLVAFISGVWFLLMAIILVIFLNYLMIKSELAYLLQQIHPYIQ